MNHPFWFYNLTALVSGMAIMAIEMTATRMLSPYFGTSIFVWTNVLGIIMAALALGYWLGGKLADRYPTPKVFFSTVVIAALVILLLPFAGPAILQAINQYIAVDANALIAFSLLGTILLFFPPFLILGLISPYLVRLINRSVEKTGHTAGNVYAMSTLGSIIGTFLPTFVTVPLIGVKRTIILFGAALCIMGAIGLGRKATYALLPIFGAAFFFTSPFLLAGKQIIAQTESPYSYIEVAQDQAGVKYLAFSEAYAIQSRFDSQDVLNDGAYWDYYAIFPPLFDDSPVKVAIIGNAGGTIPRLLDKYYPEIKIDGVELDPAVSRLAQENFAPFPDSVTLHHVDGRLFLRQSKQPYQLIIIDAYKELAVPAHLSSREFFTQAKERLAADGLLALNINVTGPDSEIYQRLLATLQRDFARVYDLKIPQGYNHLIIATDRSADLNAQLASISPPARLGKYFEFTARHLRLIPPLSARLITDDQPLTEIIYDTMILRELMKIER